MPAETVIDPTAAPAAAPEKGVPPPQAKPDFTDPFADVTPAAPEPKAGDKPPEKKGEAKPAPKPGEKPAAASKKDPVSEQRSRIETQNKTIAELNGTVTHLRGEIEALRKQSGGDTQSLTANIEKLQKENNQLKAQLGSVDFTRSDDYKTKFDKPFNDAATYAKDVIESLSLEDADGNETAADWARDFAPIYSLPRSAARARAKELFGEDAPQVMAQYDKLHELDRARRAAVEDWQKGADERERTTRGQQLANRQRVGQAFEAVTSRLAEGDPAYQINPEDAQEKELYDKIRAKVDPAYYERDKKTLPELVVLDAAIRLRAINEPILRHRLAKLQAQLDDAMAQINGRDRSRGAGAGRPETPSTMADEGNWEKELRQELKNAA